MDDTVKKENINGSEILQEVRSRAAQAAEETEAETTRAV